MSGCFLLRQPRVARSRRYIFVLLCASYSRFPKTIKKMMERSLGRLTLDNLFFFPHAVLSRGCGARGDLGQLAPRKKLLKSCRASQSISETLLALFGTEGFSFISSALPFFALLRHGQAVPLLAFVPSY